MKAGIIDPAKVSSRQSTVAISPACGRSSVCGVCMPGADERQHQLPWDGQMGPAALSASASLKQQVGESAALALATLLLSCPLAVLSNLPAACLLCRHR